MQVNVLGFGLMARQIAALLYLSGCEVTVWNHRGCDPALLERNIKLLKKSGPFCNEGTLRYAGELADLGGGITIESVVEDLSVKKELYAQVRSRGGAGYLTNSSSLAPGELGPEVGGLHFFNPITMKLVEVYSPPDQSIAGLAELVELLRSLEFQVLEVGGNRGYLGNLVLFTEISNFFKLVEVYRYDLATINTMYGKLYGERDIPGIVDLVGVDVSFSILKNLKEKDEAVYLPRTFATALDEGVLGRKNKTSIKRYL